MRRVAALQCILFAALSITVDGQRGQGLQTGRGMLLRDWATVRTVDGRIQPSISFNHGFESTLHENPVHFDLAASFGGLKSESVRLMDEELKVMISGTLRSFNNDPQSRSSWENIMATLMSNPLIEEIPGSRVHRQDGHREDGSHTFEHRVNEFRRWFNGFINDGDVLQDTRIDTNELGRLIATTGARLQNILDVIAREEYVERNVIDIGILRFPDIDKPYIKVYHIRLKVWRYSHRVLIFFNKNSNGVDGIFDKVHFRPRASTMANISPRIKRIATQDVDDIFGLSSNPTTF